MQGAGGTSFRDSFANTADEGVGCGPFRSCIQKRSSRDSRADSCASTGTPRNLVCFKQHLDLGYSANSKLQITSPSQGLLLIRQ